MMRNLEHVKAAAAGRWPEILNQLGGIDPAFLVESRSKEGPCPCCGGQTRYRYDNRHGQGDWFCSHCGGKDGQGGGGTGFDLLMRVQRWTFPEALQAVAQWLGLSEADGVVLPPEPPTAGWERVWRYSDEFLVVRRDPPGQRKEVRPLYWNGQRWIWKRPQGPLPLYNRDGLRRQPEAPVLVVEGEPAAEAAIALCPGWAVTTWHGGSDNPQTADWTPVRGRVVYLWPDNDAAGSRAMTRVAGLLPGTEVWQVMLPDGLPEGWDLADAREQGWTAEQVAGWLQAHSIRLTETPAATAEDAMDPDQARLWAQLRDLGSVEDLARRRYRLAKLAQEHGLPIRVLMQIMESLLDPESELTAARRAFDIMDDDDLFAPSQDDLLLLHYVIPGLVPVGEAVLLAGEAKSGKSLLMYEAIHAVLNGGEFLGEPCRRGKVLLLQLEENRSLRMRLAARGITAPENRGRFRVIRSFDATSGQALDHLRRELESFRPDLVALDSIRGAMTYSEENENLQGFSRPIKRVIRACQEVNAALVAIHHTNKDREARGLDRIAGTKALVGEFWGVLQLERTTDRPEDADRYLSVTPRDGQRLRMHILLCTPPGQPFFWKHLGNQAGDVTSPDLRHRLLTLLQRAGELRTGEVCDRQPGEQPDTVRRALYRLRDMGLVSSRAGSAEGTGRPPTLWSLNQEHFSRGLDAVLAGDAHRPLFAAPLSPPSQISEVAVSQNPQPSGKDLGAVPEPARNPGNPDGLLRKEEMGFVTEKVQNTSRGGGVVSDAPAVGQPLKELPDSHPATALEPLPASEVAYLVAASLAVDDVESMLQFQDLVAPLPESDRARIRQQLASAQARQFQILAPLARLLRVYRQHAGGLTAAESWGLLNRRQDLSVGQWVAPGWAAFTPAAQAHQQCIQQLVQQGYLMDRGHGRYRAIATACWVPAPSSVIVFPTQPPLPEDNITPSSTATECRISLGVRVGARAWGVTAG